MSLPGIASETSINEWMDREIFAETHYGHMHKKMIHIIVNMWENCPNARILIRKDNLKIAYERQHLSEKAAIQSATQINRKGPFYVLISLRLHFGGANGPAKWSTISKSIADLGNALPLDNTWEPGETQVSGRDRYVSAFWCSWSWRGYKPVSITSMVLILRWYKFPRLVVQKTAQW